MMAMAVLLEVAEQAPVWVQALLSLLALVPASEIGISVINQLITLLMPPRVLLKCDWLPSGSA